MKLKYPVVCGSAAGDVDPRQYLDPRAPVTGKTLRAYAFVHEGVISPLIGGVKTFLRFTLAAVRSALGSVDTGIPAFALHEYDRPDPLSHEGREVLATVAGKGLDGNRGIVVLAFENPEEAKRHDGISLESKEFDTRGGFARWVAKITGFALLPNSKYYEPGFPDSGAAGAPVQCGVLCAWSAEEEAEAAARIKELEEENEKLKPKEDKMDPITKSQIISAIKDNGWKPSDLGFTSADICGSFEISPENGRLEIEGGDPALIKPIRKLYEKTAKESIELKAEQEKAKPELERLQKLDGAAKKNENIEAAKKKIPELLKARKLDDDKKTLEKYLTDPTRLDTLPPDPDKLETNLNDYIESWSKHRQDAINPGAGSDGGGETSSGQDDADGPDDLTKIDVSDVP